MLDDRTFSRLFLGLCALLLPLNYFSPGAPAELLHLLPELCLFQHLFGVAGPGCGLTRSLMAFTDFEFARAYELHPGVFVLFAGSLVLELRHYTGNGKLLRSPFLTGVRR